MTIQDNTIIQPIPTDELLAEKERKWRLVLPADYRNFVVNYNGGIPNENHLSVINIIMQLQDFCVF